MYLQPKRIEFLDSIRGLAALAVLLEHSFIFTWPAIVGQVLKWPFINVAVDGKAAVAMFFVLSGFVLARPYFLSSDGQPHRNIYAPTFYLRRFTRIWLPWFVVFGLSGLAQATLFRSWPTIPPTNGWYANFWHHPLTAMNAIRQCLFREHDAGYQLLIQDWSLGVELKASALLPILIFMSRKATPWSLLILSVLLTALIPTGHYYTSFIMGVLLARQANDLLPWLQPKPFRFKAGLLLAGITLYETHHIGYNLLGGTSAVKFLWLGTSLGCILILMAALASRRIQKALNLSPLIFLGRISYSVYLLQFMVILCLLPPWVYLLNGLGIHHNIWLFPLVLLGSVGMTVGLSTLSYRWIETPCIDLGHRLSKKWQEKFLKD